PGANHSPRCRLRHSTGSLPRFADGLAARVRRCGSWRFVPGDTNVIHKALVALLLVFAARYWPWRVTHTLAADSAALYHGGLAAGLVCGVVALSFYAVSLKASRHAERPSGRARSVDILITTLDEDVALLRETLVAAAAIRYPHTTYLLDDGARASVQRLAQ